MKLADTQTGILRVNGWKVGDILEGYHKEDMTRDRLVITAIGQENFLCRWDYGCHGKYSFEKGNTDLNDRVWTKVGNINETQDELIEEMAGVLIMARNMIGKLMEESKSSTRHDNAVRIRERIHTVTNKAGY